MEEVKLRLFENKAFREIFEWNDQLRILHNKEFRNEPS
jgi:hypothetical protein